LLPLVYEELRKLAAYKMANEAAGQTLQATALVHEAWMRLVGKENPKFENRAHFFAAAAEAMRRILLDHAKTHARRGGEQRPLTEVGDLAALASESSERILAVDDALVRLERDDPEAAAMVRLRFYAGLGVDQAAQALGLSPRTAARLWSYARAVLYRDLSPDS